MPRVRPLKIDRCKGKLEAAIAAARGAEASRTLQMREERPQLPIQLVQTRRGDIGVYASKSVYLLFHYLASCYNTVLTPQNIATYGDEMTLQAIKKLISESNIARGLFEKTIPEKLRTYRKECGVEKSAAQVEDDAMFDKVVQYWHVVRVGEFARDIAREINLAANAVTLRGQVAMAGARTKRRREDESNGDDGQVQAKSTRVENDASLQADLITAEQAEFCLSTVRSANMHLATELDQLDAAVASM
jgi:hypothetical protein